MIYRDCSTAYQCEECRECFDCSTGASERQRTRELEREVVLEKQRFALMKGRRDALDVLIHDAMAALEEISRLDHHRHPYELGAIARAAIAKARKASEGERS